MSLQQLDTTTLRDAAFRLRTSQTTLATILQDLDEAVRLAAIDTEAAPTKTLVIELDEEINLLQQLLDTKAAAMELADAGFSTGGSWLMTELRRLSGELETSLGDDVDPTGRRQGSATAPAGLLRPHRIVGAIGFSGALGAPAVRGTRIWTEGSGDDETEFSSITVSFEPIPGGGVIKIDQFIANDIAGVPGARDRGNDRGFDIDAEMSESKIQIVIDLDAGSLTATAAGSCDANGNACHDARPWELISPDDKPTKDDNNLSVIRDDDGVRVQFRGLNSRRSDKPPLQKIPSIDGVYRFDYDDGTLSWRTKGDPFPSEQGSWIPAGSDTPQELFRYTEKVNLAFRYPRLYTHSWKGLSDDYR